MIAVIQCAAGKQDYAGHLRTLDGRDVLFVASPDAAPPAAGLCYARPDDLSDRGKTWRAVLREYNRVPEDSSQRLLPTWRLYKNRAYGILADHFGANHLYVLSAGWGLIRADFLTPKYDITFSKARNVERFKRRSPRDTYDDFALPSGVMESIVFFGGRSYIPLFCSLTARAEGQRTVFYAGNKPEAPGCDLQSYGNPYTNWHYQCARDFVANSLE